MWNGITYYTDTLITLMDLTLTNDSTVTLDLTINYSEILTRTDSACDEFFWNDSTYTQSGNYQFIYENEYGCTFTEILDLTILNPDSLLSVENITT